jgi:hypothetical protein
MEAHKERPGGHKKGLRFALKVSYYTQLKMIQIISLSWRSFRSTFLGSQTCFLPSKCTPPRLPTKAHQPRTEPNCQACGGLHFKRRQFKPKQAHQRNSTLNTEGESAGRTREGQASRGRQGKRETHGGGVCLRS